MEIRYRTRGTCSSMITFDYEDGVVSNIRFTGGCNGNLKGISALCEGKTADEIEKTLSGITCGYKQTSCPDQLAKAVRAAAEEAAG